jgi:DNA-binding CsgD family transcriptional regulator
VAVCASDIAVPLGTRNGEHYVAHVLPLNSGARRRAGASYAAVAALFVHKVALNAPFRSGVVATLYNLTPSELRVLLAIVEVGGVQGAAEALGIGEATVKTHLHRLFRKTGAARQADLVKLVAGFASPFDCQPDAPLRLPTDIKSAEAALCGCRLPTSTDHVPIEKERSLCARTCPSSPLRS